MFINTYKKIPRKLICKGFFYKRRLKHFADFGKNSNCL